MVAKGNGNDTVPLNDHLDLTFEETRQLHLNAIEEQKKFGAVVEEPAVKSAETTAPKSDEELSPNESAVYSALTDNMDALKRGWRFTIGGPGIVDGSILQEARKFAKVRATKALPTDGTGAADPSALITEFLQTAKSTILDTD